MNTVGVKDTKQQLMQAFEQIIAEKQKLDSKIATKQEEAEKEKDKQILTAASAYTVDSIVKGLADLQLEFGSIVNELSEKLAKENSKLDELNRAIEVETQYLQQLQKIRVVADTLDVLTQEHQENLRKLQEDTNKKREALEKDKQQTLQELEKEQAKFAEAEQAYNELLAKNREKEQEEYQYKLENSRKINEDSYRETKRQLEREIQAVTRQKEKDWVEREKIIKQRQPLLEEYQKKVASFPAELDTEVKKAREEAIKDTSQKAKVEADLFEKEWEGSKQSYELKITSLEQTIERQNQQIESISNQLQETLKQAKDLAMRAFDSSNK
ncbi:hypothetical protein IQ247_01415 [Plectonema cf. radiosum LEGE 06105]|uniref:Myosin heavy chain n=1 Tax=Plectonema cf. radiosum LEGE 06105 TaxID=945769 RepID=A0A8J7F8J0_9CYAN|nr:hypothetical protein [Plectonema radiosum]MBE9211388.1 hypothetical protein [Plectonema cf. radiosum LEGE 06105]